MKYKQKFVLGPRPQGRRVQLGWRLTYTAADDNKHRVNTAPLPCLIVGSGKSRELMETGTKFTFGRRLSSSILKLRPGKMVSTHRQGSLSIRAAAAS